MCVTIEPTVTTPPCSSRDRRRGRRGRWGRQLGGHSSPCTGWGTPGAHIIEAGALVLSGKCLPSELMATSNLGDNIFRLTLTILSEIRRTQLINLMMLIDSYNTVQLSSHWYQLCLKSSLLRGSIASVTERPRYKLLEKQTKNETEL